MRVKASVEPRVKCRPRLKFKDVKVERVGKRGLRFWLELQHKRSAIDWRHWVGQSAWVHTQKRVCTTQGTSLPRLTLTVTPTQQLRHAWSQSDTLQRPQLPNSQTHIILLLQPGPLQAAASSAYWLAPKRLTHSHSRCSKRAAHSVKGSGPRSTRHSGAAACAQERPSLHSKWTMEHSALSHSCLCLGASLSTQQVDHGAIGTRPQLLLLLLKSDTN